MSQASLVDFGSFLAKTLICESYVLADNSVAERFLRHAEAGYFDCRVGHGGSAGVQANAPSHRMYAWRGKGGVCSSAGCVQCRLRLPPLDPAQAK